jgi:hypothetical protein
VLGRSCLGFLHLVKCPGTHLSFLSLPPRGSAAHQGKGWCHTAGQGKLHLCRVLSVNRWLVESWKQDPIHIVDKCKCQAPGRVKNWVLVCEHSPGSDTNLWDTSVWILCSHFCNTRVEWDELPDPPTVYDF